jgi:O-antigen/teichoic acid export membrane protein
MFSLLMAVGPSFIHGALGQQWWRAADFLFLAVVSGLLLPPAWICDAVQWGAGRTGLNVIIMLIEQGTRLALMYFLIQRLQFVTIYIAAIAALSLKAVVALAANHKLIVPLRLPPWTSVGAPLTAGAVNYGLWALLARYVPEHHAIALFFIGGAGSFVVTLFACGFIGGFDTAALDELDQAARMSAFVRPICRFLAGAGRLGARLSPFPKRQLALAAEAAVEAQAIDAAAGSR